MIIQSDTIRFLTISAAFCAFIMPASSRTKEECRNVFLHSRIFAIVSAQCNFRNNDIAADMKLTCWKQTFSGEDIHKIEIDALSFISVQRRRAGKDFCAWQKREFPSVYGEP